MVDRVVNRIEELFNRLSDDTLEPQSQYPPQPWMMPPHQALQLASGQSQATQFWPQQQHGALPSSGIDEVRTLWIGDLQYWMDENYLKTCFYQTGELLSAKVIRNEQTGQSEGYGFLDFRTRATAEDILQIYNGTTMPNAEQAYQLKWATHGEKWENVSANNEGSDVFLCEYEYDIHWHSFKRVAKIGRDENDEVKKHIEIADSENKVLGSVAARAAELETDASRLHDDPVSAIGDMQESSTELSNLQKELEGMKVNEQEKDAKLEAIEKERDLLMSKVEKLEGGERSLRDELVGKVKEIGALKKNAEELQALVGSNKSLDSSGRVQFWDGKFGTLLQAHSYHKGDVNALAAAPNHNRVFSAGSDGQVILYKLSSEATGSGDGKVAPEAIKKWVYVGYVRAHKHDVRALTVAVPICHEDLPPDERVKGSRGKAKPLDFSYHKWAHLGVPMLISAGDDTKLFAYSVKEFTKFSPHDICPAPQRMPMQLVLKTVFNQSPLLLIQASRSLDIYCVRLKNGTVSEASAGPSSGVANTDLVAQIKSKNSRKIICSAISSSGTLVAYSDHVKPSLVELKRSKSSKSSWSVNKKQLPQGLPFAHCMAFSSDSSRLLLAGQDRRIYVVDVGSGELVYAFTPCRKDGGETLPPSEPPITKMFTSTDGQWLAAINCFGDLYIFNLETLRQHWFMSRLDGASVTAGGFTPRNSNILIISTSSNQVYALDVEAKQLGDWSMRHTFSLPRRYQEFPGEVIGLSFQPSSSSSSVIVYSPRAMCLIDFGMPVDKDDDHDLANVQGSKMRKLHNNGGLKRRRHEIEAKQSGRKNFEFCAFRDPVLLVEHLSKNSLLVIDKPWIKVVDTFDAQPVHRHIYGT